MKVIEIEKLQKVYRVVKKSPGLSGAIHSLIKPRYIEKRAITNLSLTVSKGETVGFIGLNGAGKSTTIKMMTGVLQPTSGTIRVLDRDPYKNRTENARDIGVVFGQRSQLWWDLPLIESLNLISKIYRIDKGRYEALLSQFSHELELEQLLSLPIRQMSLGQKMRAELAATLIHEPKILFLDEPTIGLDIFVKEKIRAFILSQNKAGNTTVFLTSHDLGDIEELCKRVVILDEGSVIFDGTIEEAKLINGSRRELTVETKAHTPMLPDQLNVEIIERLPYKIVLRFEGSKVSASSLVSTIMNCIDVTDFTIKEPNLSSIVKELHERGKETLEATNV